MENRHLPLKDVSVLLAQHDVEHASSLCSYANGCIIVVENMTNVMHHGKLSLCCACLTRLGLYRYFIGYEYGRLW